MPLQCHLHRACFPEDRNTIPVTLVPRRQLCRLGLRDTNVEPAPVDAKIVSEALEDRLFFGADS